MHDARLSPSAASLVDLRIVLKKEKRSSFWSRSSIGYTTEDDYGHIVSHTNLTRLRPIRPPAWPFSMPFAPRTSACVGAGGTQLHTMADESVIDPKIEEIDDDAPGK